ncbi:lytic transglycosylase domain-containing protein [Paracoccaceae bacterium Fryx2]|nr:lytic transglycosylase domain-containing protein [Paracoccaceae bacterium Fryx2]
MTLISPPLRRLAARLAPLFLAALLLTPVARADPADSLRAALGLAAMRDWPAARATAEQAGPVAQSIVEWQRLRAGEGLLGDYEAFLARHPDWPGLALLRQKGEAAVARSSTPARVVGYFGAARPGTAAGSIAMVRALQASGRGAEALAEAERAWVALRFEPGEETAVLALEPGIAARHEARLDKLLWQGRVSETQRMLPRVSPGWRALAAARMALHADAAGVTALIEAVPAAQAGDPGLAYERFVWRMRKGRDADAAALILERSGSAAALGDPDAWADRRAVLARGLMRASEAATAYRVASRHWLQPGSDYADLEFLAGFIALRKLGDAETALTHFRNLKAAVATPISLSRALYWEGRAEEAAGRSAAAEAAYRAAARYQTAYYGLLAAERLGLTLDAGLLSEARPADWRSAGFAQSSVLAAARLLLQAGDRGQAKRFMLHLAEKLNGTELDQLSDLALSLNEPHVALLIAKQAAERGVILPRAYFPVTGLVPDGGAVSRALALAISRRESEFDPAVISPAGARGLMQVMPGTAQLMAPKLGLPFAAGRLTADPAYNVAMGTGYLRQLVDEFGPSIALVASGYNAGPGRPRRWIGDFGDPRLSEVDVIDWVETIPFTETRTYVMRVVESVVIYRAKLRGTVGPVRVTAELRG